jgi:hypothetical protein
MESPCLTRSERAVIYDLVKLDIEGPKARERKAQAPGKPRGTKSSLQENFPEEKGQARDKAAATVGWSGRTAEKALVLSGNPRYI